MDQSNETVVDKAVNFVKDVFGMHDATRDVANPETHETASEEAAENAMKLDPNPFAVNSGVAANAGLQLPPGTFATPMGESDTERLRREVDEYPREKSAAEMRAESAWREDNG